MVSGYILLYWAYSDHTPSPTPSLVSVRSAGRMEEVITGVRCGVDSTMFLTETGRVYACGK